jgi:hypothetical protein
MGNKFVGKDHGIVGRVKTIVRDKNGELRHSVEDHNDVEPLLKYRLNHAIMTGTFEGMSDFLGAATSATSDWTGNDGIMVFNTANTTGDGTLLACAATANPINNSIAVSGENSLYDSNTLSYFALGANVGTDTNMTNYFTHTFTPFAYSAGDTITVNWTVSVT